MIGTFQQRLVLLAVVALGLAGCDTIGGWFDDAPKVEATGERISVLAFDSQLDPDPQLAETPVALPRPGAIPNGRRAAAIPAMPCSISNSARGCAPPGPPISVSRPTMNRRSCRSR